MAADNPANCLRLPLGPWSASRIAAALALALTLALIVYGLLISFAARGGEPLPTSYGDAPLYLRIIDRVHAGEPYYPVVAEEHRRDGYPLRPFVTVRLPTVAIAMGALPDERTRQITLMVLAVVTLGAWVWRLSRLGLAPLPFGGGVLLVAFGVISALSPTAYTFHETWAGMLIALSLALHGRAWLPSVLVGLAAALTRELSFAYLLAMLALAAKDRRWTEAAAWLAAMVLAGAALAAHVAALREVVLPTDVASPGWAQFNGWPFLMDLAGWNMIASPGLWLVALLLPLSFLGLVMLRCPLGERVALTVIGYAIAFMAVGRATNVYWGLMIAPLWPLGVVFAPAAVKVLVKRVRGRA